MNLIILSTAIFLAASVVWVLLSGMSHASQSIMSQEKSAAANRNRVQKSVVLGDVPPPDDSYTPEQRRNS